MKFRSMIATGVLLAGMGAAHSALAAAKTYQVTGPVLEVSPTMIAVQKGKDRWEIARDAGSSVPAGVKVGDKVTVEYRMTATTVTMKAAPAAKGGAKKKK